MQGPSVPFAYSIRETLDPEEFGFKQLHPWRRHFLIGTDFGLVLAFDCDPVEADYAVRSTCCMASLTADADESLWRRCVVCDGVSTIPNSQALSSRSFIYESDRAMFEEWLNCYLDPLRSQIWLDDVLGLVSWFQNWAQELGYHRWFRCDIASLLRQYADADTYLTPKKILYRELR